MASLRSFIGLSVVSLSVLAMGLLLGSRPAAETFNCTPDRIGVFPDRVYVQCYYGEGSAFLYIFMLPTKDAEQAKRALNLMSVAMLTGRQLALVHEPRPASPANPNCVPEKCRMLLGVGLGKAP